MFFSGVSGMTEDIYETQGDEMKSFGINLDLTLDPLSLAEKNRITKKKHGRRSKQELKYRQGGGI